MRHLETKLVFSRDNKILSIASLSQSVLYKVDINEPLDSRCSEIHYLDFSQFLLEISLWSQLIVVHN